MLFGESDLLLVGSLDLSGLLDNMELNMAVGCEVRGDPTMGSVGSSSSLHGSLGGNVEDLAFLGIKTLGLGVALQIFEEVENVSHRLLWVPTVVVLEILANSVSAGTASESSERNDGLVLESSLHVCNSFEQVKPSASSGSLVSVLEMSSQVVDSAGSRLGWFVRFSRVLHH